ncbi:phosphatase PAP2 family protein [Streptomyces sp. AC512_CC834]|uniref:phosphatase PAP2 family protein n=1 Tax=Streptomyces sp. AC512_CC834 TaxID=2823691 RepID=UPI0020B64DDA|nr:phosphatase PAP2 family protein [Streptomyces sp. AC512_CC834]
MGAGGAVLPARLRGWLEPVAALAALVVVVLGIRYAGAGGPGAMDTRIREAVEAPGTQWWHVATATNFLGEPLGAALLVGALVTGCVLLRCPRGAVLVVAGAGLTVGTTTLLKPLVGRTIHDGNLSYPSGHTAFLTAIALAVALLVAGRLRLGAAAGTLLVLTTALVAGAAMGWAQVVMDAHYPTDAVGGFCTALAVLPVTARLVDRIGDRIADRIRDRGAERATGRTAGTGQRERR